MSEGPDKISVATWAGRGLLITVAAALLAISTGAITLPFGSSRRPAIGTTLAAERSSADQRWASGLCTNVLDWKNELTRDGTSLNLGFGVVARIQDAIAATSRMVDELNRLGLPPGAQTAQARAEIRDLRSELESRVRGIEGVAGSVAGGNLAAIGDAAERPTARQDSGSPARRGLEPCRVRGSRPVAGRDPCLPGAGREPDLSHGVRRPARPRGELPV